MPQPPTPRQLEASRDRRVAQQNLAKQQNYVNLLRRAARLREDNNQSPDPALLRLVAEGDDRLRALTQRAGGTVVPRRRPRNKLSGETCRVFIDECGAHSLTAKEPFPAFILAAVIVRDADWPKVDSQWRDFKAQHLGSADIVVHEPDVRRGEQPFAEPGRAERLEAMRATVAALDFSAFAVVVNRPDYVDDHGTGPIDSSLPQRVYLMALDFLLERVVLALDTEFDGARAQVIAESRGAKEDVLLQYEFARVQLDGTSYIAPGWFRSHLCPGIVFEGKSTNNTGLQLADLLARPIGEKAVRPNITPYLWPECRAKLCPGQETKNSILGLKLMPWRDRYLDLWKAEGATEAAPSADQARA
jgi:Protein of unknown function (DUF3800)